MPNPSSTRSVKISSDERGGWSTDRPRPDGAPPRPPSVAVRCRVLRAEDRLRYSPGSLLVVVSASKDDRDRFIDRLIEDRGAVLSLDKVRALLAGRLPDAEVEARSAELLEAAAVKRLQAGATVVLAAEGLDAAERERFVRLAAGFKRPRHLILLETARDRVDEDDRSALNDLRTALDAGELGAEGFQTVLRLGGGLVSEVKEIVFRPAPREE